MSVERVLWVYGRFEVWCACRLSDADLSEAARLVAACVLGSLSLRCTGGPRVIFLYCADVSVPMPAMDLYSPGTPVVYPSRLLLTCLFDYGLFLEALTNMFCLNTSVVMTVVTSSVLPLVSVVFDLDLVF